MTAKQPIDQNISEEMAHFISQLMLDKKAEDIRIIDVQSLTTLTDFFVICSSDSDPKTKAIVDHIDRTFRKNGIKSGHIEGYQNLKWVLIDYWNVIVHIFNDDSREYYGIERLWADGKIIKVKDEPKK